MSMVIELEQPYMGPGAMALVLSAMSLGEAVPKMEIRTGEKVMTDVQCPWCHGTNVYLTRQSDAATEYACRGCNGVHTRRSNDPDSYAFFPADVEAAFLNDLEPLCLTT
jgi:hypothetical protein